MEKDEKKQASDGFHPSLPCSAANHCRVSARAVLHLHGGEGGLPPWSRSGSVAGPRAEGHGRGPRSRLPALPALRPVQRGSSWLRLPVPLLAKPPVRLAEPGVFLRARHPVAAIGHPVSTVDACKLHSKTVVSISTSRSRPELAAGPAFVEVEPTSCEMGPPPAYLCVQLHLFSFLVYFLLFLYLFLSFHSCMASGLHPDRDARFSYPLPFSACIVSVVLVSFVSFRQLLLRRWFDDAAFIWDIGSSSSYLWQRLQHHLSVAGICLLRWLIRFPFNRRSARSIHRGASVLDTSVYSARWHASLPRRLSRRCCLYF